MENKSLNTTWLIALLLGLFLGCFGAHRFYVGKTQTGIIMVLITILTGWIGGIGVMITGIWSLIDVIMLIMNKFTDGKGNIIPIQI